jgi:hypothetical protein
VFLFHRPSYGRGGGVGRGLGVRAGLGVGEGLGVKVGVAVEVGVDVGVTVGVWVTVAVGVDVAVAVAVAVAVGVGVPQKAVTLTSTDVVVLLSTQSKPPTATAVLPTFLPAGNQRSWFRCGPMLHVFVTGSYTCSAVVVSGLSGRLSHAPTPPLFPAVGIVPEPLNGKPPPKTHNSPAITADPGALTPRGRVARAVQLLAAMS